MSEVQEFGIPDVELSCGPGKTLNPTHFAGHPLVMLFCPAEQAAAERELAAYNGLSDALANTDSYLVAISGRGAVTPASRVSIVQDPKQRAWNAIRQKLGGNDGRQLTEGAVILFGRGGCLNRAWTGAGHVGEVKQALGERM